MNVFQINYEHRLRDWRQLRTDIATLPLAEQCVQVDKWWQQTPFVNHHLAWNDTTNWPDPWTLLSENTYCLLTRAVGMCYTLLMSDVTEIELVHASDSLCEEHYLVLVDGAKYVMNYWPNTVLSTRLTDFKILNSKDLEFLKTKIK